MFSKWKIAVTSRHDLVLRTQTLTEYLRAVMCKITLTVKQSPQPGLVAWRRLIANGGLSHSTSSGVHLLVNPSEIT
jgi:hypothetical protein